MVGRKIRLSYFISAFFVIFTGMLGSLSIFMHCDTNIYDYDHTKMIVHHTPYLYIGMAAAGIGVVLCFCKFTESRLSSEGQKRISNILFAVCGGVIFFEGIYWIWFNDCAPIYDQRIVFQEAQKIAGVLEKPFDTEYFAMFHRNRGITLFMVVAIKVFGNHLHAFRIFNLAAIMVIYYSICRTAGLVFKNQMVASLTAVFLMIFYPLVVYTSFMYGTLLSIAGTSLGLYAAAAWCETGKLRYGTTVILAFSFGILMHQSAAIGLVAAVIYFMMKNRGQALLRSFFISLLTVVMMFVFMKGTDIIYIHITGTDSEAEAVPVFCTIYMGLSSTAEAGGPGSIDGSFLEIYESHNGDAAAANQDALDRIGRVAKEYLTGERSLRFLLEKIEYQWLDPSFGARKIINLNDTNMGDKPNSDSFLAFYNSSMRQVIFKAAISFMLFVYAGAFIAGIRSIADSRENPAIILLQLYVIGGGMFQMLWESLSRYCLGYFLWIIPIAAFGVDSIYCFIQKVFHIDNLRKDKR